MTLMKSKYVWLTGSMVLVGALIACGDEKSIDDGTGDDPSADGGSSGNGGSSGASSSGGGSSGTVEAKGGTISLTQTVTPIEGQPDFVSSTASASFYQGSFAIGGTTDTRCTTSEEGSCRVTACDLGGPAPDAGPTEDAGAILTPHAGEITIGATPITLTPTSDGVYATKTLTEKIWDTADFSVKAAGATVPAFEKLLQVPASITLTAPVLPDAPAKAEIDRSADLALTWTGGGGGVVTASAITSLLEGTTLKKSATVSCTYPANAGTGTIPAAALGKLLVGDGSFVATSASQEQLDVDGWKITIQAVPGGSGKSGLVTFR